MATVKLIEYEEASPEVRQIYDDIMTTRNIESKSMKSFVMVVEFPNRNRLAA